MSVGEFISRATKTENKNKNKTIKERDIESEFVKYAKQNGCLAIKLILLNLRGFPDRTVLLPGGKLFFIEFKKKRKELSASQLKWQSRLLKLGFSYYVCDEPGQAEKQLARIKAMGTS